jgi:L-lactate utilization protein LutB
MDKKINSLLIKWQKRNISGLYCNNKNEALDKILEIVPGSATVGISGSVTLDQLGLARHLESRGNKVFNPYKADISKEESWDIRRQGTQADFYLASANAISENGELVFFSAYGNRIAGISYAKNVILVCGVNKITPNLEAALKRARQHSTPLNCKRLNWSTPCAADGVCRKDDCFLPEHKSMCCQILIIEAEVTPDRLKIILVGENLGF